MTSISPSAADALDRARDLEAQSVEASARLEAAREHLSSLLDRNLSGDTTVTGADLVGARADVEIAEGLARHAAESHNSAKVEAATMVAVETAAQVRAKVSKADLDKTVDKATRDVAKALEAVQSAYMELDAHSDAVGQELARVGVPAGVPVEGIRYVPVRRNGTGAPLPGKFNVEVFEEDGTSYWLSSSGNDRATSRLIDRATHKVIDEALRPSGRKLALNAVALRT